MREIVEDLLKVLAAKPGSGIHFHPHSTIQTKEL